MKLGISGLEDQAQSIDPSRAYLVACSAGQDAVNLALGALHASSGSAAREALFLYGTGEDDLRHLCSIPDLAAKSRARVLASRSEALSPSSLSDELLRSRRGAKGMLCVCLGLRGGALLHLDDPARARQALIELKQLASALGCAVLVVAKASPELLPSLSEAASPLAGFATLERSGSKAVFCAQHWEGALGGASGLEAQVECGSAGFAATGCCSGPPQGAPDAQSFYIAGESFTPDLAYYSDIRRFEGNEEAFEAALESATAATVVLRLFERSQSDRIARMAYDLRMRRGSALSIIIWERAAGVRADTEKFFIACGASFVFESGAAATYVSAMLPCFRSRAIPIPQESFEEIRGRYHQADSVTPGVKTASDFISKARDMLSRLDSSHIPCTLAVLLPKRGVPPLLAARNFMPRRGGDICAAFSDSLWVFLPSCRPSEAPVALRHAFTAQLDSLFSGVSLSGSAEETARRLGLLKQRGEAGVRVEGISAIAGDSERRSQPGASMLEDPSPLALRRGGRKLLSELAATGARGNIKEKQ